MIDAEGRPRGLALLLGLLCFGPGCGASRAEAPDPLAPLRAENARLRAEIDRLGAEARQLAEARDALQGRLDDAEARLGLRPFRPTVIRAAEPGLRFEAGKAVRIDAEGARPKPEHFGKHFNKQTAFVVAYWATWCKPCTTPEELATVKAMRRDLLALGSDLAAVGVDKLAAIEADPRAPTWVYPFWQADDAHLEWLPERFVRQHGVSLPLFLVVSGRGDILYWHARALDEISARELVTAAVHPRR